MQGEPGSLIMFIRNMKRRDNPTDTSNHLDLACGVFFHHSDRSGYKQADPSIMEVDSIPNGIEEFPIGGNSNEGYLKIATCIYEEAILR
jgi:hypothetical protein